jgi:NAD(P)-dependent dehydrogenase (short-subunit alcohol dehydrogenase family)
MRKSGGAVIVNVAGNTGLRGAPELTRYGAAKAGVVDFIMALAHEWAPDTVCINAVAPGPVITPGSEEQLDIAVTDVDRNIVDRRIGTTCEIADIVQFLTRPRASFVYEETIPVRGVL